MKSGTNTTKTHLLTSLVALMAIMNVEAQSSSDLPPLLLYIMKEA